MSYQLKVIKDKPIAFWPMDDISGTAIIDASPASNNGTYSTTITNSNEMPLVYGFDRSFKNKNNTITFNMSKNTDRKTQQLILSADNDFSLECWIYPSISSTTVIPIFSDTAEDIGIFYDNGTIVFSVFGNDIRYTLPHINQSAHIVGTYTPSAISLFINGESISTLNILPASFEGNNSNFKSGPTSNSQDYYLANCFAIYRYAINESQVKSHYDMAQSLFPLQVVTPHSGEVFEFFDDNVSTQYVYSYPGNKSWEYLLKEGLSYNEVENKLYIPVGEGVSKTIEIIDAISIPSGPVITDSKIEWDGDNGISVSTSLDGITYTPCVNGQSIPGYQITTDQLIVNGFLGIKITFATDDDSKYNPELNYLSMSFYKDQITYASNSSSYLSIIDPPIIIVDPEDPESQPITIQANMSNYKYPILSRHDRNGIKVLANSGFDINTVSAINTIEFFYTPTSLSSNIIFSSTSASYGSTGLSGVSSSGITKVLVNGVDKTSQTAIGNVLEANKLHHMVFILDAPCSGAIRFHDSAEVDGLYQNISIYSKILSQSEAVSNYLSYINPSYFNASENAVSVTEDDFYIYNNDWIVVQNT